jgi:hypothetical protein
MAYLNNEYVTVDAVLTTKGRELLARNDGSFRITQFALSDDEIDYTLYNPNHPSGSAFYGQAIEAMPLLQAFVDNTQDMKYQLVTLPRGTAKLPVLNIGGRASISLQQGATIVINPTTLNYLGTIESVEPLGYLATVSNQNLIGSFTGTGVNTTALPSLTPTPTTSGAPLSISQIGTAFTLTATSLNDIFPSGTTVVTTTITFVGRNSGARISIPFTVTKKQ